MSHWKVIVFLCICIFCIRSAGASADEWRRLDDQESFEKLNSDTTLRSADWPQSKIEHQRVPSDWSIEYCSDGTGELTFWEQRYPRRWAVTGGNQLCVTTEFGEKCYFCEENTHYKDLYRCGVVGMKHAPWVFTVTHEKPAFCR